MTGLLGGCPDDVALMDASGALTYGRLADEVTRRREQVHGDGPMLTWLYARNDRRTLVAYLAAIEAGHPVALVDPGLPEAVRADLERAYRPELVVGLPRAVPAPREGAGAGLHPDLALLLLTSGSTGSPKAVRLSRRAVFANAASIGTALGIDGDARAITTLPPFYSYGLSVLNSHLLAGAGVVLSDVGLLDPVAWAAVDEHRVTSLAGVPYTYAMLRRLRFLDRIPASLRTMTQAGGRLDPAVVREFATALASAGVDLFVMYGQTEATARMAVLDPAALPAKAGSVGRAVPGGAFDIGTPAGDSSGEIVYRGPNVMSGYATSRADLVRGDECDGVLATGDLGRIDDEGDLWITGRIKRIAKVSGVRIGLEDVEALSAAILAGLGRSDTSVAAVAAGDRVAVWYENPGADDERRQLARELAGRLQVPPSMVLVRGCESLPRTGSGKIAFAELEVA